MNRVLLTFLLMSFSRVAFSANIVWNSFSSFDFSSWESGLSIVQSEEPVPWVSFGAVVSEQSQGSKIVGRTFNTSMTLLMALVDAGSVFSQEMIQEIQSPFFDQRGSSLTTNSLTIGDDPVYLALMASNQDDGQTVSGWIELAVDGAKLVVLSSAVDLDGGVMVAGGGAVPEPTNWLLFLIGVGVLALKRGQRHKVSRIGSTT